MKIMNIKYNYDRVKNRLYKTFGAEFPLENRSSGAGTEQRDFSRLKITKTGNEFCRPTN